MTSRRASRRDAIADSWSIVRSHRHWDTCYELRHRCLPRPNPTEFSMHCLHCRWVCQSTRLTLFVSRGSPTIFCLPKSYPATLVPPPRLDAAQVTHLGGEESPLGDIWATLHGLYMWCWSTLTEPPGSTSYQIRVGCCVARQQNKYTLNSGSPC